MNKEKILLFIPAYKCENQLPRVIKQLTEEYQNIISEVLIVENKSPDKTFEYGVKALNSISYCKVTAIQNVHNYSLGGSHKVAFNYAIKNDFDYIIVLHGDDQGSISDLIPYIKSKEIFNFDSFLGSRFMKGSKLIGYSKVRVFGNLVLNLLLTIFLRRSIFDMGSGLNMYSVDFIRSRAYEHFPNNLTFNIYMLFYSIWSKSKFTFFPLTWREEDQNSNAKMFRQAFQILGLTIQYAFSPNKTMKKKYKDSKVLYKEKPDFIRDGHSF